MSLVNFKLPRLNDMPKMFDTVCENLVLLYLERDTRILQTCQYILDVLDINFDRVGVDFYELKVDGTRLHLMPREYYTAGWLKARMYERLVGRKARGSIGRFLSA